MKWLNIVATYLHVLGVATYLGGSVVMEFVLGPAQKGIPPAQAQVMGEKASKRFLVLAWAALALIPASGVLRLVATRNLSLLWSPQLVQSSYGRTLLTMLILWAVLVINGALMTFVLRPKMAIKMAAGVSAGQVEGRRGQAIRAAEWTSRMARIDLGVAAGVALLGSALGSGGLY